MFFHKTIIFYENSDLLTENRGEVNYFYEDILIANNSMKMVLPIRNRRIEYDFLLIKDNYIIRIYRTQGFNAITIEFRLIKLKS